MFRSARVSWRSVRCARSGLTPISRRRSCVTCALASLSISTSTCTQIDMSSRGGLQVLRWELDRHWHCYRRRMQQATSSKWYSDYQSESNLKATIRARIHCSSALQWFLTCTFTSRLQDLMLESFFKLACLNY